MWSREWERAELAASYAPQLIDADAYIHTRINTCTHTHTHVRSRTQSHTHTELTTFPPHRAIYCWANTYTHTHTE